MNSDVYAMDSPSVNERLAASVRAALERLSVRTQRKVRVQRRRMTLLLGCMAVISAVATYDMYWSFKTQSILAETEQNPIGSWLIRMDGGDVALFMTAKAVGTVLVLCAIPLIYRFRHRWGLTCGVVVAGFQSLLFAYLTWGEFLLRALGEAGMLPKG